MKSDPTWPTNLTDFLAWEGVGDFRWEFYGGQAHPLPRDATRRHATIATSLAIALSVALEDRGYSTGAAGFAMLAPSGVRVPDVIVDSPGGKGSDVVAFAPLLAAEVLSPESRARDFGDKLSDYLNVRSLLHYIVLEQDEMRVWPWSRCNDGWPRPIGLSGKDAAIPFDRLALTIPLSAIYPHLRDGDLQ